MEALMASAILLIVVVSVTSAVTSAQSHSFEARQQIAGTIAAEEIMGRLVSVPYADLPDWNGFVEAAGSLKYGSGDPFPASFNEIGRDVAVVGTDQTIAGLSVMVRGRSVRVRSFDANGHVLVVLERFVPEPPSS